MKLLRILALATTVIFLTNAPSATAETPMERAQKIKEWRANCNDPDPDLRVAYLEGAIATKDRTVVRTCVKQALASDNDDVRNLAIRAALASSETLALQFSHTAAYFEALEKAGSNSEELKKVNTNYRAENGALEPSNGVVSLSPIEVQITSQTSRWYAKGTSAANLDGYTADLALVGSKLTGSGTLRFGSRQSKFTVSLTLADDGVLVGTGNLGYGMKLPVTLNLY